MQRLINSIVYIHTHSGWHEPGTNTDTHAHIHAAGVCNCAYRTHKRHTRKQTTDNFSIKTPPKVSFSSHCFQCMIYITVFLSFHFSHLITVHALFNPPYSSSLPDSVFQPLHFVHSFVDSAVASLRCLVKGNTHTLCIFNNYTRLKVT